MLIILHFSSDSLRFYIFLNNLYVEFLSSNMTLNGVGFPLFVSLYFPSRYALLIFILPILTHSVKKIIICANNMRNNSDR